MDDFYITIFSNSSSKEYPENSTSKFTVKLPRPLDLSEGNWCCGLTEIFHPPIVSSVAPGLDNQDEIVFPSTFSEGSFQFDLKTFVTFILENSTRPQLYSERYFHQFLNIENLKEFDLSIELLAYKTEKPSAKTSFRITPFNIAPQYRTAMKEKDYIVFESFKKYNMRQILWIILNNYYLIYMGGIKKIRQNELTLEQNKSLAEILLLYVTTFVKAVKGVLANLYPEPASNFLLLYCDIIEPTITGDTITKLFFITARKKEVDKDVISIPNVRYFNVSKKFVENITFFISDETGSQIYFEHGFRPTVLVIHFRKN